MLQMTKVKDSDSVGEGEVREEVLHYCRDFKICLTRWQPIVKTYCQLFCEAPLQIWPMVRKTLIVWRKARCGRKRAATSSFPPTRLTVCLFVVVVVCLFGWWSLGGGGWLPRHFDWQWGRAMTLLDIHWSFIFMQGGSEIISRVDIAVSTTSRYHYHWELHFYLEKHVTMTFIFTSPVNDFPSPQSSSFFYFSFVPLDEADNIILFTIISPFSFSVLLPQT